MNLRRLAIHPLPCPGRASLPLPRRLRAQGLDGPIPPVDRGVATRGRASPVRSASAFTIMEVMIAMALFFMATFAILNLVTQNLRLARGLGMGDIDISTVAAEIALTNMLAEGTLSGDFGDQYPGASWHADVHMVSTNANTLQSRRSQRGLFEVNITIDWPRNGLVRQKRASILLYRDGAMPDAAEGGP